MFKFALSKMSSSIIIILSILLLLSYIFDISSSKTGIPSVIMLILLGLSISGLVNYFKIDVPDFTKILPELGTIGLILIVLEGSLELHLNKEKITLIKKSFLVSLISIVSLIVFISIVILIFDKGQWNIAVANAIPFAVISSAIAISSAKNLPVFQKEFVTYDSSFSDILAVLFFNFFAFTATIKFFSIGVFLFQLIVIFIISILASVFLTFFIHKIKHKIKFLPIIIIVVLIYFISKSFHLPALLFILIFGLVVGNIHQLRDYKIVRQFKPDFFQKEVFKFHELTIEFAFVIRSLFFLLFGYSIQMNELLDVNTLPISLGISLLIFLSRYIILYLFKLPQKPMLFIAPRGLISVILFLTIPTTMQIEFINKSLLIQVIFISSFVMMFGLINFNKKVKKEKFI